MRKGRHHIVSTNPTKGLNDFFSSNYKDPFSYEYDSQNKVEIITVSNYSDAISIYTKLRNHHKLNETEENYWHYFLLNQRGYEEFKSLRKYQKFNLIDIKNHKTQAVNFEKLEYKNVSLNGGAIISNKQNYNSAINFWVNAVNKANKDNSALDVDLDGGTYNPISLETLESLVMESCSRIENYIEKSNFISSIEISNGPKSGTFFVETTDQYCLIDVYCP